MKQFEYVIKDPLGIHARPAGMLVKTVAGYKSDIKIESNGKTADAKRLLAVMGLAIKTGQGITFTADGEDEEQVIAAVEAFCAENL